MKIEHTLNTITSFTLKAIVITVCIGFLIPSLLPDFNWVKTMQGKLIIASFIQNPTVLWKLAEQQEAERKYKDAANLLDIAVGLLEMNCSSAQALSRYQKKREYLISLAEKNQ
jgi:hypothetical protein